MHWAYTLAVLYVDYDEFENRSFERLLKPVDDDADDDDDDDDERICFNVA